MLNQGAGNRHYVVMKYVDTDASASRSVTFFMASNKLLYFSELWAC